jgi:hypothetical protein
LSVIRQKSEASSPSGEQFPQKHGLHTKAAAPGAIFRLASAAFIRYVQKSDANSIRL